MNKGIAFAGNLNVDQIKFIEQYPSPQALTSILEIKKTLGGLVCNCAIDVAKLDSSIPLKAIGIVGEDDAGDFVLEEMKRYPSISCEAVKRTGQTSFTDVMTQPDGGRTFFQYRGANALLCPEDFDFNSIEANILHIGYILLLDGLDAPDPEYPTALCRVLKNAKDYGIKTSIDVVSEEGDRFSKLVPPALQYTDYCMINEIEAGRTTGILLRDGEKLIEENMKPCLKKLAELGVHEWVVIHTPELSCGYDVMNDKFYFEKSWDIPDGFKKSSVGAGDAFASGMLIGAYYGWDLGKAIHIAGAIAAYSLSGFGSSNAIKALPELLEEMKKYQK